MTTLATVLNGAATITTTTTPSLGTINSYSASGGALAVALPGPIAGYNAGATMVLEKAVGNFCEYFEFIRRKWTPKSELNSREAAARAQLKKLFGD